MLRFSLHQLELEALGRFFVPLPKLSSAQALFLEQRMVERGFSVRAANRAIGRKGGPQVTIELSGLAWSNGDLLDAIGPAIPELLSFPKETSSADPYFVMKRSPGSCELQFFPRMESGRIWSALRAEGKCGLTPDEGLMVRRQLKGVNNLTNCVSGNPRSGSSRIQIGRTPYYESALPGDVLASSLRVIDSNPAGNAYLPKSATLKFDGGVRFPESPVDNDLGEWCYLVSPAAKTSN